MLFALLATGIAAAGYLSYRSYERGFRTAVEHELSAVAELKVGDLARWRRERLGDASVFCGNPAFSGLVRRWFAAPDDVGTQARIRAWLGNVQAAYQYDRVILLDARGVPRMSVPDLPEPAAPDLLQDAPEVLRSGRASFRDFHRDAPDGPIRLTVLAPILDTADDSRALGVVVLRIDPERYLYPLLQRWPGASTTAETLLVRRDGNDVLFLNQLRFRKDAALKLRSPLTRTNLPAVKAVLGQEGVEDGVDYRGVPVFAAVRLVPDSPWSLVARMDAAEVYAPLRERRWMLVALVGITLLAAGAGFGFVWRQEELRSARGRYRVAEALNQSEARFRLVAESANDAVYEWDLRQGVEWSGRVDELLGYAPGEFPRTLDGWADALHPEDRERVMAAVQAHLAGRAPYSVEYRVRARDGSYRSWSARGVALRHPDGTPRGWMGTITDITERKRGEEALREREAKYRTLAENIPQRIFMKDRSYRWVSVNEHFARDLGLRAEDVIGKTDYDLFPKELADKYRADDEWIMETGRTEEIEERTSLQGRESWVHTIKTPVRDEGGTIVGVLGVFSDITERKRAEEALRGSEERLRRAVVDSPFPLLLHAEDGSVLQVSNSWCEVTGYTREELATIDDWTERAYGDRKRAQADIEALYGLERRKAEGDYAIRIKDGTIRTWEFSSAPLGRLPDGRRLVLSMAMDVTERRKAESEVRRLNAELEQRVVERTERLKAANEELEAFSYSVSHDLRAPLRHIDGYVGLLLERCRGELTEQGRHYVDTIADSARQMGRLIDELLQFSRNGRAEMHETGVDMNRTVREALNSVADQLAGRTIDWVIGDLPPVRGDGAMLRLVWANLLGNAIKYTRTKANARIEIGFLEKPDETVFFVRDDGVGFDMRYAHKLFGVFQRLHSEAEFEGTGIGLATVRRIVSRHDGRTWAEGEPGTGAAFYFSLPRSGGDGPCPS